jgi:hypothetical protein
MKRRSSFYSICSDISYTILTLTLHSPRNFSLSLMYNRTGVRTDPNEGKV